MPLRLFTLALLAPLFFAGCMAQRDATEMDDDTMPPGGAPNVPTYVYGTWDYTLEPLGAGERLTGMLTIVEEGAGRFTSSSGMNAEIDPQQVSVTAPNFVYNGTVQAEEPFVLTLAGSVTGDNMEAEANLGDMGTYRLTARRMRE